MVRYPKGTLVTTIALGLLLLGACGDKKRQQTSTQRERDSVIGESALPGAGGVRGAMSVADSARARREREARQ